MRTGCGSSRRDIGERGDTIGIRTDLREGRANRFPLCCTLRYTLEAAFRYDPEQALNRGIRVAPTGIEHVPCWIRHKATLTHREHEHMLNIREFQCRS